MSQSCSLSSDYTKSKHHYPRPTPTPGPRHYCLSYVLTLHCPCEELTVPSSLLLSGLPSEPCDHMLTSVQFPPMLFSPLV